MKLVVLRTALILVALTGLFAGFVLCFPWTRATEIYKHFGIELPATFTAPYLEYLTYLGAALSVVVGALYFVAGMWPSRYRNIIPFLGWSLLFIGMVVSYHGFRLDLPPWPFYPDPIISFLCGAAILFLNRRAWTQGTAE